MNQPLISIITVCKNSEKTIENTIKSVLNQTYKNFEYIIVDGASSDNTLKIIQSYVDKFDQFGVTLKHISKPDNGIYDAMNRGIKMARGDWISFLGSDDSYVHTALETYSKYLDVNFDLVYSDVEIIGKKIMKGYWNWNTFRRKMTIPHVGAMHNMRYFQEMGLYNAHYKVAGDYELLLRAKKNLKTQRIEQILLKMSPNGISNNSIKLVYKETSLAKKETADVSAFICAIDYYVWMTKYYSKKVLNAAIR